MTQYVDIQYIRETLGITGTKDSCKGYKYNERIGFACNTYEAPSFAYVCEVLDDAPIVEAEPVRHGKWIDMDVQSYTWKVRCSVCGHERSMMSTQGEYPKYCEECGARMDEE